jgi:hypothetical protein|tara:strand:+ start:379 stop:1074 length:696 start_codon:yes stop_codon:yes gene_type:complete
MLGLGNSVSANQYPGGWTPTSLGSKLIHWYKFDTGLTTATVSGTDGLITQWTDQKGSNNLAPEVTNDGTKMPILHTDNSVRFSGSDDVLVFGSALTLGKFAIYGRFRTDAFNDRFLQQSNGSEFIKFQTTTEFRVQPGGSRHDMTISGDANLANNTKFTAGFERDGDGDILASANGLASTTSANTAISNTVDAQEVSPANAGALDVFEFIICNDSLSASERTEVNAYLDAI